MTSATCRSGASLLAVYAYRIARAHSQSLVGYRAAEVTPGKRDLIRPSPNMPRARAVESAAGFLELAAATGGRALAGMMNSDVLPALLTSIAAQIRGAYIAGYYVPAAGQPKRHSLEVRLVSKDALRLYDQVYGASHTVVH